MMKTCRLSARKHAQGVREANRPGAHTAKEKRLRPIVDPKITWLGLAWLGLAWLGLAWLGLAWLGLAWLGLAKIVGLIMVMSSRLTAFSLIFPFFSGLQDPVSGMQNNLFHFTSK
jgi:hypothetical protein